MTDILTNIFLIFAVIDPIGSIPVYLEATKEFDIIHKKKNCHSGINYRIFYTAIFHCYWSVYFRKNVSFT